VSVERPQLAIEVENQWKAVFGHRGTAPLMGRDAWEQKVFLALKRYVVDAVRSGFSGIRASNDDLLRHVYMHDPDARAVHAVPETIRVMRSHWKAVVGESRAFSAGGGLHFRLDFPKAEDMVLRVEDASGPVAAEERRLPGIDSLIPRAAPTEASARGRALLADWCARDVRDPAYVHALSRMSTDDLQKHAAEVTAALHAGLSFDISRFLVPDANADCEDDADGRRSARTFAAWFRQQWPKLSPEKRAEARVLLAQAKAEGPGSWRWAALVLLLTSACGLAYYAYVKGLFREVAPGHYSATIRSNESGNIVAVNPATGQESEAKPELRDQDLGAQIRTTPGSTPDTFRVRLDLQGIRQKVSHQEAAVGHAIKTDEIEVLTTWSRSDIPKVVITGFLPVDDRGRLQPVISAQSIAGAQNAVGFFLVPPLSLSLKEANRGECFLTVDDQAPIRLALDVVGGHMTVYKTPWIQELSFGMHRLHGRLSLPQYGELSVEETIVFSDTGTPRITAGPTWRMPKSFIDHPPPGFTLDDAHSSPALDGH